MRSARALTVLSLAVVALGACGAGPTAPSLEPAEPGPSSLSAGAADGRVRTTATISGEFRITQLRDRSGRAEVRLSGETAEGRHFEGIGTMKFRVRGRSGSSLDLDARIDFDGTADGGSASTDFRGRWTGLLGDASVEPSGAVFTFGPATGRLMGDASAEPSGNFRTRAEISGEARVTRRNGDNGRAEVTLEGEMANGTRFEGAGTLRFRVVGQRDGSPVLEGRIDFDGTAESDSGPREFRGRWTGLLGEAAAEPSGAVFTFGPATGKLIGDAAASPSGA